MTSSYPAWFYGPAGAAQIFQNAEDVPAGWKDHPSKLVVTAEKTGSKPLTPSADQVAPEQRGSAPVTAENDATSADTGGSPVDAENSDVSNTLDAEGWAWDASLHAATQTKTKAGLWRMAVGISRPDPKPGYPKPVVNLDL